MVAARAPAAADGGSGCSGSPDARQLATTGAPVVAGDHRSDARHSSRPDGGSRGGDGRNYEDAVSGRTADRDIWTPAKRLRQTKFY